MTDTVVAAVATDVPAVAADVTADAASVKATVASVPTVTEADFKAASDAATADVAAVLAEMNAAATERRLAEAVVAALILSAIAATIAYLR